MFISKSCRGEYEMGTNLWTRDTVTVPHCERNRHRCDRHFRDGKKPLISRHCNRYRHLTLTITDNWHCNRNRHRFYRNHYFTLCPLSRAPRNYFLLFHPIYIFANTFLYIFYQHSSIKAAAGATPTAWAWPPRETTTTRPSSESSRGWSPFLSEFRSCLHHTLCLYCLGV